MELVPGFSFVNGGGVLSQYYPDNRSTGRIGPEQNLVLWVRASCHGSQGYSGSCCGVGERAVNVVS